MGGMPHVLCRLRLQCRHPPCIMHGHSCGACTCACVRVRVCARACMRACACVQMRSACIKCPRGCAHSGHAADGGAGARLPRGMQLVAYYDPQAASDATSIAGMLPVRVWHSERMVLSFLATPKKLSRHAQAKLGRIHRVQQSCCSVCTWRSKVEAVVRDQEAEEKERLEVLEDEGMHVVGGEGGSADEEEAHVAAAMSGHKRGRQDGEGEGGGTLDASVVCALCGAGELDLSRLAA